MVVRTFSQGVLALVLGVAVPVAAAATPVEWSSLGKTALGVAQVEFPPELLALDGDVVTVTGFMVPLEAKAAQTRFLLTQTPQDCEFCLEGGPESYIEVQSEPLAFSMKPFVMEGRLVLLPNDSSGMYFRMADAKALAQD